MKMHSGKPAGRNGLYRWRTPSLEAPVTISRHPYFTDGEDHAAITVDQLDGNRVEIFLTRPAVEQCARVLLTIADTNTTTA